MEHSISLEQPKRAWELLARKVNRGTSLAKAAGEAEIPIEEARTWASGEAEAPDFLELSLRRAASAGLEVALVELQAMAQSKLGDARVRLGATKELARLAIAVARLTDPSKKETGAGVGTASGDAGAGPWELKRAK